MNYDIEKGRKAAKDFKVQYEKDHCCCPKCGGQNYSSTYIGYIVTIREDYTIADYKDENRIKCKCGWKGITHELISKK